MKKGKWIWLLMVVAILTGCSNATTFNFEEFVDRYPDEYTTEAEVEPEIETESEGVEEESEKVLYKTELVVSVDENQRIYQYCVFGDVLAYASKNGDKTDIHWVSISEETDELIKEVDGEIDKLICCENRIAWLMYNEEFDRSEVYIYENGRTINCIELQEREICWDDICFTQDYLIAYSWTAGAGVYTYDLDNGYIACALYYNDFIPGSQIIVSAEGVISVVTELVEWINVQTYDDNGGILYEKAIEGYLEDIQISKELLLWHDSEYEEIKIEIIETGSVYSVENVEEVCISGKWMFYSSGSTIEVSDVYRVATYWSMELDGKLGDFCNGDIGQIYYTEENGKENEMTIEIFTMK